jgi:tripartite-type tricarboxylate transporter receptor subunit TctC
MNRRKSLAFAILGATGALLATTLPGIAQPPAAQPPAAQPPYPSRVVRLVVSFPPGSSTDLVARLLADRLGKTWASSVVVENITGAAGQIGTGRVVRSEPDGHTLIVSPPAQLITHAALYKNLSYDPAQLIPITLLAQVPYGLTVRKDPRLSTVKDFVAYAKANPGKLTYASQGLGSTSHLTAKLFEQLAGISMLHVTYRGSAPALTDLVAGNIDSIFDNIGNSMPLHADGRVQIIGVADLRRVGSLPTVPTFDEVGFPGFRSITWFALAAPPKTPDALINRINRDVVEILKRPDVQDKLRELELTPAGGTPAETAAFIKAEAVLWDKVIRDGKVEAE